MRIEATLANLLASTTRTRGRLLGLVCILALLLTLPASPASAQASANQTVPPVSSVLQFGSAEDDVVNGITANSTGVYVAGSTDGRAFVRKYDRMGNTVWTDYLAADYWDGNPEAQVITSYGTKVYVAGKWSHPAWDYPELTEHNAYVRRYDQSGNVDWTEELGHDVTVVGDKPSEFNVSSITADSYGVYVQARSTWWNSRPDGSTYKSNMVADVVRWFSHSSKLVWQDWSGMSSDLLSGGLSSGLYTGRTEWQTCEQPPCEPQGRLTKFTFTSFNGVDNADDPDFEGAVRTDWVRTFKWTSDPSGTVLNAIAADSTGVYALANGNQFGRFDSSGNELWRKGISQEASAMAADSTGVYLAGKGWVSRYDTSGALLWTHRFGNTSTDTARTVAASSSGLYVAGDTTGALPGETNAGKLDAFVLRYDTELEGCNSVWTRQFGTSGTDQANAVAAKPNGLYVAGDTTGALPGKTNAGLSDAYVRKYDQSGTMLLWTRQFGTVARDHMYGIDEDPSGVYVVGSTGGALPGQTSAGSDDAFVRKYDLSGNLLWTRQFGGSGSDEARAVTARSGVYVAGRMAGKAFVRKYDNSGNLLWNRQYRSSGQNDEGVYAIAADSSGVYVAGDVDGVLSGQTSAGMADAYVLKYDHSGNLLWTRQFGSSGNDRAYALVVDSTGVYASGGTDGALPGQTSAGNRDAFVRKYDSGGNLQWTRQFGTSAGDEAFGITADSTGVYATGDTGGTLTGQKSAGSGDAFVRKFGHLGKQLWTHQFGSRLLDDARAISVDSTGLYAAGSAQDTLPCQSAAGGADAYLIKLQLPDTIAAPYTPDLDAESDSGASDTDDVTNNSTPTFTGFAESESTAQIRIVVDGQQMGSGTVGAGGAYDITTSAIPDGTHSVTAVAVDGSGNASKPSAALSITVDTKNPTTPTLDLDAESDSGVSDTDHITNDSTPTFTGQVEPKATVTFYADGQEHSSGTADPEGAYSFAPTFADGMHSVATTATDTAGNVSERSTALGVTIDTVAPVGPSTPDLEPGSDGGVSNTDNITNVNKPTFTGSAEAGTSISITAGGNQKGSGTADSTGAYRATIGPAALADGTYSLAATSMDTAGNLSTPSGTLDVTVDTKRPTVSYPIQSLVASTTLSTTSIPFKIAWSGTDDSGRIERYELQRSRDGGAFTAVSLPSPRATSIQVWLEPGSANQFRVAARDVAGNWTLFMGTKWRSGPVFRVAAHQEDSSQIAYTGDWTRVANTSAYGGYVQTSTTPGAKATFTFQSANVGVVMPRRSDLGVVKICMDPGTVRETCSSVDLSPSTTSLLGNRKLVWVRNNLNPADQHMVSVTVESGRVDLDAFALAGFLSTNQ